MLPARVALSTYVRPAKDVVVEAVVAASTATVGDAAADDTRSATFAPAVDVEAAKPGWSYPPCCFISYFSSWNKTHCTAEMKMTHSYSL